MGIGTGSAPRPPGGMYTYERNTSANSAHVEPSRSETDEHLPSDASLGQFSITPATHTTVVTTTTTTTTRFPPLIMQPPYASRNLDPKVYPLAASRTPEFLRNIRFTLGDTPMIFQEPSDTVAVLNETNDKANISGSSKGRRSPNVRPLSEITHKRSSPRSRSKSNHLRPVSPISLPESARASRKTHSNIDTGHTLFQSRFRSSATQARDAGLVTPETEGGPSQTSNTRRPHPLEFSQKRQEKANHEQLSSPEIHSGLEEVDFPLSRPEHSLLAEHRTELSLQDFSNDARDGLIDVDGSVLSQDQTFDSFASTKNSESMPRRGRLAIQNGVEQDGSLPSPRLSPVAVPSAQQLDNSFDSAEDQGTETDASGELTKYQPSHGDNLSEQRQLKEQAMSLLDMPAMLGYFESMPEKMQVYMMYQMLRRCPKPTLHFVADVVNPALKCDFLALLPPELSLSIVQHFDFRTMCRAAQVSKKWRHIVNSDEKTWKKLFEQDGFILPEGELQRAIEEGWGWQYPNGDEDYEKDLRLAIPSSLENESLQASSMSHWTDASGFTPFSSRRLKRKATMKSPLRRVSKRRSIMSSPSSTYKSVQTIGNASIKESPYAAANAAAMAIPYPAVGLPSLHNLHLFKSLYQRHYSIKNNWMRGDAKPMHIAFRAHTHHVVTCLQFDTDKILTGSDDTNINVYDTDNGALRATLRGHEGGVWALEYHGNTLVSGSTDRSVRVWDIERAECTQVFQGHTSTVRCLQILLPVKIGEYPDGTPEMIPKEPLIITGSRDSSLRVWKLPQAGDPKYFQHTSGHNPYFVRVLTGHQHSVRAIAAYADTLVSGSYDCTVRVWKISTGEPLHRLEGHSLKVYSVVLDHKRNRCISGSMDNQVKIWSLETGTVLYNLEGHSSLVGLLDLQAERLISAAADSTLRIWDPENGQCKNTLTAHTGAITCFQHDNSKVISGSDRTLKMWNVQTGECLKDLLTNLSCVWQVRFNQRRCVAAVQRNRVTYIEVLDFGASRDHVPNHRLGERIVVNRYGDEAIDDDEDEDDAADLDDQGP